MKAGARESPANVSFGQRSPGTTQGTTTRIGNGLRCHCQYCDGNENVKKAKGLGNVHTILDRIYVGMNTILDRACHTKNGDFGAISVNGSEAVCVFKF